MIINRDLNIDQNNRDYHFGHDRAALLPTGGQFHGLCSMWLDNTIALQI